jgi:DNA-binding CsgD family transcriptional regulator
VGRSSKHKRSREPAGEQLTAREQDVLALVADGEPTSAISQRLGISENTIKSHLTSVYRKTGSRNRVQAARHYLDQYGEPPPIR